MIFTFLIVLIVALVLANVFVSFSDKKGYYIEQNKNWEKAIEPEIVMPIVKETKEEDFLDKGKIIANEQKIKVLNQRLGNLEKVVFAVAERGIESGKQEEIDVEKMDFRLKVLEQEIETIKNPKKENGKTFYGQKNDPMEEKIKSLAFNSGKK